MECLNYDGLAYFKGKLDSEISATLIVNSTSGTIASFPDGADGLPVKDLTVGIEPVQNLNGYSEPWPGGGGSNKLSPYSGETPSRSQNGLTCVANADGTYKFSNATSSGTFDQTFTVNNYSEYIVQDGDYIHFFNTFTSNSAQCLLIFTDNTFASTTFSSANKITSLSSSAGKAVKALRFYVASGVTINDTLKPMIVASSTAVTWAPYSNICPISGWTGCNIYRTGKNLLNCQIEGKEQNGVTSSNNLNGSIHLQGTTTGARFYTYLKNNFNLKPGTYRFSKNLSLTSGSISVQLQGFNSSDQIVSRYTVGNSSTNASVSITEPAAYYNVFIDITSMTTSTAVNLDLEIQLELGSTASAWEQFYGATIPVSWQSEAGTVYGGTLTVNEDGSADLVVDYVSGNITGACINSSWTSVDANRTSIGFYMSASNWLSAGYPTPVAGGGIFDYCKTGGVYNNDNWWNSQFLFTSGSFNRFEIRIPKSVLADYSTSQMAVSSAKTYLNANPLQAVYKVAPTTYHLTGIDQITTLLGTNNIWADCGDITDLEYVADTKLYIDNKIATAIANALNA